MKKILFVLLSAVLLSLPWLGVNGIVLFVAFLPLFLIRDQLAEEKNRKGKPKKFLPYAALTFFLWSVFTVWWIWFAVQWVVFIPLLVITFIATVPFLIFDYVAKRAPKVLAYTILVAAWAGYEYVFISGQLTFPWLILGNGFANTVSAVQWYEYTGVLGGSVWILVANILLYEFWKTRTAKRTRNQRMAIWLWLIVPLIFSLIRYYTYTERVDPLTVHILQPNIDPYTEKFDGLSQRRQTEILVELAAEAPAGTDFILAPETAIDDRLWEHQLDDNGTVGYLQEFLRRRYPDTEMIVGATTFKRYDNEAAAPYTARTYTTIDYWYDVFNSALLIDSTGVTAVYHKMKLVPGAETIPYLKWVPSMRNIVLDMAGQVGQFGLDDQFEIMAAASGRPVGVVICYESVYGEFSTEYIRQGAEALFIITNDGWWKDTPGYRQHFSFARLRAIELRRGIARSANTGISGFIDQRGQVIEKTRWDERIALTGTINRNDKVTFYARYGDMIGRIAIYTFLLSILYFIAYRRKKRDHLVE